MLAKIFFLEKQKKNNIFDNFSLKNTFLLYRNYGFNSIYEPTMERSRRKQLMDALGSN